MRSWYRVPVALCVLGLGAGCVGDAVERGVDIDDGPIGRVEQEEIVTCPADIAPNIPNVKYDKELVIKALAVVDDPCRTVWNPTDPSCTDTAAKGKWSFWYLASQAAGNNNVSRFVSKWLESFEEQPFVNGQTLAKRNLVRSKVIDPWRQKSGCTTGLKYDDVGGACTLKGELAPFRLLAIVNRADLRAGDAGSVDAYGNISTGGDAGEARFIFGFTNLSSLDGSGKPLPIQASVIFEYRVPTAARTAKQWAIDWRGLGSFTNFDASYKSALQAVTDRFVKSGVTAANSNNGSALSQVRTDDFDFDPNPNFSARVWSLREFKFNCLPGQSCGTNDKFLVNTTTAQTPPDAKNKTMDLQDYLNLNVSQLQSGKHEVKSVFNGAPFLGVESTSKQSTQMPFQWDLNFDDPALYTPRRIFAFSTCNGCHYLETDNSGNMHVKNRKAGVESVLSPFLLGYVEVLNDPYLHDAARPEYDEPLRRKCELLALAAGKPGPVSTATGRPH